MVNMAAVRPSVVLVLCTLLWILPSSYGAVDPCTDYKSIDDPYRSAVYKLKVGETAICDSMLAPGWYRFTSNVGGKMPTTKPEPNHCGTAAPIWMKGTHPTTKGEVASALACTNINNLLGGCMLRKSMSVKNCGEFFVYNLQPSGGCSMAYCAGNLLPCPKGQTGIVPNCRTLIITPFPFHLVPLPSVTYLEDDKPRVTILCKFKFPLWKNVSFHVEWFTDGHLVKNDTICENQNPDNIGPACSTRQSELQHGYYRTRHRVACKLRMKYTTNPKNTWTSLARESDFFFVGNEAFAPSSDPGSGDFKPPAEKGENLCPGDCSNHGNCTNRTCICEEGFTSDDCSMSANRVPELLESISISNDGEQRSIRQKRFVSDDSVCMECTNSSSCKQKNGTCLINGHCFAANESNPKDWCLQCLPSENISSWSPRKVNHPPIFDANQSTRFAILGEYLPLQFKATDPDNRPVKYALISSTATGYTFSSTGLLTWNVTTHTNQQFVLNVTDECNATDTLTVALVIQPCNCVNGGKCFPVSSQPRGSGHYRCECPNGFTGAKCEENVDDCLTAQCVNGTCVDGVNDYTCRCDTGFTGILCDQPLPRCTNQTCFPGVSCTEVPSGVSCGPCPAGFSGDGKTCVAEPTTSAPSTTAPTTVPTTTLPPPTTTAPTTTTLPPTTTAAAPTTTGAPTTTEPPTTTQPATLASTRDTPTTTDQGIDTTQLPTSQARFNETSTKQAEKPTTPETTGAESTTNTAGRVVIECKIKILRQWDDKYSDVQSDEFRTLSNILWKEIWASFVQKDDNFIGVVVSKLRKGSIIAEFELTFKSEPEEPLKLIKERIKEGKLGQLEVDSDSLSLRDDDSKEEPEPKEKDSVVLIIVLVVLAIVIVVVIVVVIIYTKKQKRTRNLERIRKKDEDGEPGEMLPLTEKNSAK